MNREVAEAMHDLAGTHPGISMFLQDPTDDFASAGRGWDGSVTTTTTTTSDFELKDSFVRWCLCWSCRCWSYG
jgi:hypothetical protein